MINIRAATPLDVEAISTFRKIGNQDNSCIDVLSNTEIEKDVMGRRCVYYIAEKDGVVVGQIICEVELYGSTCCIKHIAVLDSEKGTGLAHQLMDKAKEMAMSINRTYICLSLKKTNYRALYFFRSHGFRLMSTDSSGLSTMLIRIKDRER